MTSVGVGLLVRRLLGHVGAQVDDARLGRAERRVRASVHALLASTRRAAANVRSTAAAPAARRGAV